MTESGNALTFEQQPVFDFPYVDLDLPASPEAEPNSWKKVQAAIFNS